MATSSSPRLFTSLRYDSILLESTNNGGLSAPKQPFSPVYMLRYHRDRLVEAAKEFHLDPILAQLEQNHQGLFFLHKTIMDHVQEAEKHVGRAKALKVRRGVKTSLNIINAHLLEIRFGLFLVLTVLSISTRVRFRR